MRRPLTRQVVRSTVGGYQLTEFAGALLILVSCIIIPLINLGIVPVRFGLGTSIVSTKVHQLAKSETLSQAFNAGQQSASFADSLKRIGGIVVKSSQLLLTIESTKLKRTKVVDRPGTIPKPWLPDGANGPCIYSLELNVDADVYPLVTAPVPHAAIPGLTRPISTQFHEVSTWENLGRDPATGEFFVNE
jgi:hypothetical protein